MRRNRHYAPILTAALVTIATSFASAQSGGTGGGASAGSGASIGGSSASTAGVGTSAGTSPGAAAPGQPGPVTGVGVPGGTGAGSTTVVPTQPNVPQSTQDTPTVGRESGGSMSTAAPMGSGSSGPGRPAGNTAGRAAADSSVTSSAQNFNPEAVTDKGLDSAKTDILMMSASELRDLVALLEACSAGRHPVTRTGSCGAANRKYRSRYANDRSVDRTLTELDRTVRFQTMFKASQPDTRYEDSINDRLRNAAKSSLAVNTVQPGSPNVVRDVRLPTR